MSVCVEGVIDIEVEEWHRIVRNLGGVPEGAELLVGSPVDQGDFLEIPFAYSTEDAAHPTEWGKRPEFVTRERAQRDHLKNLAELVKAGLEQDTLLNAIKDPRLAHTLVKGG